MSKLIPALALTFAAVGSIAAAHPKLVSAAPAAGSQVAAPRQVRIVFSEPLFVKFSGVVIKDASGKTAATGAAALDPADAKVLVVPVKAALAPGAYHLSWHAVSTDTHHVQGEYDFVVR